MRTTGRRSAICVAAPSTSCSVAPAASGSENGTPSSSRSAPASAHAAPIATVAPRSGKPPIRYGISAARPGAAAQAAARLSVPEAKLGKDLREILVAAAGEADEVERVGAGVVPQRPRQRMRGLERRDDALELA